MEHLATTRKTNGKSKERQREKYCEDIKSWMKSGTIEMLHCVRGGCTCKTIIANACGLGT